MKLIDVIHQQPICSPELTGNWEKQLNMIAQSKGEAKDFDQGIRSFTKQIIKDFEKVSLQDIPRLELGPCPGCSKPIKENRKGFSCWSTPKEPGCGFVIWKQQKNFELSKQEFIKLLEEKEAILVEQTTGAKKKLQLKQDDNKKLWLEIEGEEAKEIPERQPKNKK